MKRKFKKCIPCILAAISVINLSACNWIQNVFAPGKCTTLATAATAEELHYNEQNEENYQAFRAKTNDFSAAFSSAAYEAYEKDGNFTVSPISLFMALSLTAECSLGVTQEEILSALNTSQTELNAYLPLLYRSLNVKHTGTSLLSEKTLGKLQLCNSVWVNESTELRQERLDLLSNTYFCDVFSADFEKDNAQANLAVQRYVDKKTNGLIDRKFHLDTDTLFSIINTLYLKDVWTYNGDDITRTKDNYTFVNADSSTKSTRFLQGRYITGRAYETETCVSYYTRTYHGYKIKFLLPKDGYTVEDIFSEENLAEINAVTDYDAEDEENLLRYHTRCLFPEYSASYYGDVRQIIKNKFGVDKLFDVDECDFSPLTPSTPAYCGKLLHATKLTVNRKGIEGAAVTVMQGAGAPGPDEYTDVYVDFVVDKAFGFILTDSYNVPLFSGVIKSI